MNRPIALALAVFAIGCAPEEEEPVTSEPPQELVQPDLEGIDVPAAFEQAVRTAVATDLRAPFAAHAASMSLLHPGCPDLYAGPPDPDMDEIDIDARGVSWSDHCSTGGGREFGGFVYWDGSMTLQGDPTTVEGRTSTASRELIADGVIAEGDDVLFEFDGTGSDSVLRVDADGFNRFVYNSLMEGTVTGSMVSEQGQIGDLRTDMYLAYTGGDADTLEARGNVFFFDHRIQEKFDSIHLDIAFASPTSTEPGGCDQEPLGFVSLRDSNAFWYDLVFQPRYDEDATDEDYENDPYVGCDGCGVMYVRGLEQPDQVCIDLSFLWDGGTLIPPDVEDYALSMREVFEEDP